jgi:hypothetical protein
MGVNLAPVIKPTPVVPKPKSAWFGFKDQTVVAVCLTYRGTVVMVGSLLAYIKPRFFGTGNMIGLPASMIFGQEVPTAPLSQETPKGAGYPDRRVWEDKNCTISHLIEKYELELELITINQIAVSRCLVASRATMDPETWEYDALAFQPCTGVGVDPEWHKQLGFPAMDYAMWAFRGTFAPVLGVVEQQCGLPDLAEAMVEPVAAYEIEAAAEVEAVVEVVPTTRKKRLTTAAPRAKKETAAKKPKAPKVEAKDPTEYLGLDHPETPEAVNEFQASLDRCLAAAE